MAQPAETECSCVPVNGLKSDIDEGRSPFGDDDDSCYQVDSKLLKRNNSAVNGKTHPINEFLNRVVRITSFTSTHANVKLRKL